jgi:hypothetical protein
MDSLTSLLKSLSIESRPLSHPPAISFEAWAEGLISEVPERHCVKTLVLKPSVPKGATAEAPSLLMLVASHSTKGFSLSALAKALGFKDARGASDETVTSTFALASKMDGMS